MDSELTVKALVCQLKREIEERRTLLAGLEARCGEEPETQQPTPARRTGMTAAAVEVLREVGRPMHGLGEILPALKARGFDVSKRAGFASVIMRSGQVVRVAPGTYALKPARDGAGS
jgi:hypothetical protein